MMQTIHQSTSDISLFFIQYVEKNDVRLIRNFYLNVSCHFYDDNDEKVAKSDVLKHVYSRHSETTF